MQRKVKKNSKEIKFGKKTKTTSVPCPSSDYAK